MERKLIDAASRLPEASLAFDDINSTVKIPSSRGWKTITTLAACVALLVCLSFGTCAIVAEAQEYRAAVAFFQDHGLSTEGLSRADIKAIYLDITTKSFTYSKTGEVIERSLSGQVGGNEILQENPSPEEIENLWNYKNYYELFGSSLGLNSNDIYYSRRSESYWDSERGRRVYVGCYVEKFQRDTLVWSVFIEDFWVQECQAVSGGVIACGYNHPTIDGKPECTWLAMIDDNGNLVWKIRFTDSPVHEWFSKVLENQDGSYTSFSTRDGNLILRHISKEGVVIDYHKIDIQGKGVSNAVFFGDGYLVQLYSYNAPDQIIKLDRSGHISQGFVYESTDLSYFISDMIEYNGEIYLSAYAVPKPTNNDTYGGRTEIAAIVDYIKNNELWLVDHADVTSITRDNYMAILFRCGPHSGSPQEFYSIYGSMGGNLEVNEEGELVWDVESITDAYWSPLTSSFSIGGTCCIVRYSFNKDGLLVRHHQTGELVLLAK